MSYASSTNTNVAIVGGGPAGLMLSHLLALDGISSIVVDTRSYHEIETTHRAGILERDSVRLLVDSGVSERVLTDGHEHQGIDLRFGGVSHRIDFQRLVGASCWLYPQTDVFIDLFAARTRDGGDLRYGITDTVVTGHLHAPNITYSDDAGSHQITADLIVGADGSRSICRELVTSPQRYFREYPFAWFGVLVEAPPSAPELIYARSPQGFALISQRTATVQRMYFQCDPRENPDEWSDDRIWEQLQTRLRGDDGFRLQEGPIIARSVLPFRSFVQTPMREGRLLLAGDAAHTVPPTGAKGLNLALADVQVLADTIVRTLKKNDDAALDGYTQRALSRVWKAQHFSYWMTTMLHRLPDTTDFDELRQLGELDTLVSSEAGSTYLAEGYTGWPHH
ncbi:MULTISPECIES: 4-hydroxybenzoate 3-monooxygenase [unclassified Mycolicibacterium]|uniref:4-hydroxybenzoate 3-monooxygenase n=1 Tax=unclassified Mycolicibacterium TaxID=2636767 RepID=UPI0012DD6016|nr:MULTISPECIES: 4-hydroxybenzoate 3-monooxygenase [unclassified Mycolicibacterium]MUL83012.1 4-hydroxybenzoate 3-monooxygenase [Mycolicibacterium sp. CBMA 329]MUL89347.1 4-hydroxybenzoate 3-monooxygenase [Mycolicibacterium sp. CBMA 331]MUL99036.1 4-hydroxybenzoate 3-monooxygenase [Mycolicibacterium sp. CBMA 334]MUM25667.1 4-hydroxybenzoate 3-monooxygenase [Mycolicibacterium sp. CBMA 295]MUM38863.1 4-hydroxybenzoate 3-monooxygenase [Mycolicibacterium sp. CBMA 247]